MEFRGRQHDADVPVRGSGCILLVDDDQIVRAIVSILIEELGYQVLTAIDGADAIEVFRQNHEKIDLVLLDMVMPIMNGSQCFYHLKEIQPDVKVLMVSGFPEGANITTLERDGLAGFFTKPYRGVALSHILSEFIKH